MRLGVEVFNCVPPLFSLSFFVELLALLCRVAIILMIIIVHLITFFSVLPVDDYNLISIRQLSLLGLGAWLELRMYLAGTWVDNGGHLKD